MNVKIGQTTYHSLCDAADTYGTTVNTLVLYLNQIKNRQRLE